MYYFRGIYHNLIFLYDDIEYYYNVFHINHNSYKKDQSVLLYKDFNYIRFLLNRTHYNLHNHELSLSGLNFAKTFDKPK